MKQEIFREIEIPEGVEVEIDGGNLTVKHSGKENKRAFKKGKLILEKKDRKIIIGNKNSTKREKRNMNTIFAHINNMLKGVQEEFEYELKIAFSHFPMTVEVKGNEAKIKNFLGEKVPRKVSIPHGAKVEVKGDKIIITASDKEIAGQAAANFENATRIRKRDRRVFQDGIYIIKKAGKDII